MKLRFKCSQCPKVIICNGRDVEGVIKKAEDKGWFISAVVNYCSKKCRQSNQLMKKESKS